MCITIANVMVLALFGTVGDDKSLDSANSFFTFLYGVEIGELETSPTLPPQTTTYMLTDQIQLLRFVAMVLNPKHLRMFACGSRR